MLAVLVAAGWLSSGGVIDPSRLLCDLALLTTFVAARERRHPAMLAAAGLACGLAPGGAMLLPIAIGVALSRRVPPGLLLLVPLMALAGWGAGLRSAGGADVIGLWSLFPAPALAALLAAIAVGSLAWSTAALSVRVLSGEALAQAAAACALGAALTMPGATMAVPLALTMACEDRRLRIVAGLAALLAVGALPIAATLALGTALWLAVARLWVRPANDNVALRPARA